MPTESEHCGQESERPILTPGIEQLINAARGYGADRLDDSDLELGAVGWQNIAANMRRLLDQAIAEIDNAPPDLHHEWWCEFDGDVEVSYHHLHGLEFERVWVCPWCERVHSSRGHRADFDDSYGV